MSIVPRVFWRKKNAPAGKVRKYKPVGKGWKKRGPSGVLYTSIKLSARGAAWIAHVHKHKLQIGKSGFVNLTVMPTQMKGKNLPPFEVFCPYWGKK